MADSIIYYQDLIGEDDTFDNIFENIEELKKELFSLTKIMQKDLSVLNPNEEKKIDRITTKIDKLIKAKKELDRQEKKATQTKKKLNNLTDKELIAREKLKIANRERVQKMKQIAILTDKESGHIEKLRAELSLTTIAWKKLSKEELKSSKIGKSLTKDKLRLTNQLKKLEKQTGDTRRNVGNYNSALGKTGKLAARLFVGRSLFDGLRRVGSAFKNIFEENEKGNKDFEKFRNTISSVTEGLKGIGLSIIQFIVPIVQGVIRRFQFFSQKIAEASGEGTVLGSVFEGIKWVIKGVIDVLLDFPFIFSGLKAVFSAFGDHVSATFTRMSLDAEKLTLVMQEAFLRATGVNTTVMQKQIAEIQKKIDANSKKMIFTAAQVGDIYKKASDEAREEFAKFEAEQDEIDRKAQEAAKRREGATERENKLLNVQIQLRNDLLIRVQAIENLQKQLSKLEASNIKNAKQRARRLEELRFEAEKEVREKAIQDVVEMREKQEELILANYEKSSEKYKEFIIMRDAEILKLTEINDGLETEQLKVHEQNKLNIKIDFAEKTKKEFEKIRKEEIDETDAELKEQDEKEFEDFENSLKKKLGFLTKAEKETRKFERQLADLKIQNIKSDTEREIAIQKEKFKRMREDIKANEKLTIAQKKQLLKEVEKLEKTSQQKINKERTDELLDGIIESSKKIGQAIVDVFEKQSDLATSLVEEQADAVETQQQRAEDGLSNTLKFEKDELAKREGERIRAEQKAKNAAKILALFNLVSAYAGSGDANALQRGLVDFALLTALESAFTGFEEGGFTGSDSSNKKVKGVVHANEYVVTQSDVDKFGLRDKSGSQFGEAMSDYFNQSPLLLNTYDEQNTQFSNGIKHTNQVDFSRLEHEVRAMRQAFQNQQKNDFDIEHMTDYFVDIAKRVTQNRMTTVTKVRKRL